MINKQLQITLLFPPTPMPKENPHVFMCRERGCFPSSLSFMCCFKCCSIGWHGSGQRGEAGPQSHSSTAASLPLTWTHRKAATCTNRAKLGLLLVHLHNPTSWPPWPATQDGSSTALANTHHITVPDLQERIFLWWIGAVIAAAAMICSRVETHRSEVSYNWFEPIPGQFRLRIWLEIQKSDSSALPFTCIENPTWP